MGREGRRFSSPGCIGTFLENYLSNEYLDKPAQHQARPALVPELKRRRGCGLRDADSGRVGLFTRPVLEPPSLLPGNGVYAWRQTHLLPARTGRLNSTALARCLSFPVGRCAPASRVGRQKCVFSQYNILHPCTPCPFPRLRARTADRLVAHRSSRSNAKALSP